MQNYYKIARLICPVLLIAAAFTACAQSKYGIKHSYVYTQAIFPGNVPQGIPGKPRQTYIDTATIIYIETAGSVKPAWDIAWKKGNWYSIAVTALQSERVAVGRQKKDKRPVAVQAKKGDHLWVVQFSGILDDTTGLALQKTANANQIVLAERNNGKRVLLSAALAVELEAEMRP